MSRIKLLTAAFFVLAILFVALSLSSNYQQASQNTEATIEAIRLQTRQTIEADLP